MKILIATMGPGETSQGSALARYLSDKGILVNFLVVRKENLHFVQGIKLCKASVCSTPSDLKTEIGSGQYDAVFLFNSKIFGKDSDFIKNAPSPKPPVFSVDSNWLFNQPEHFPYVSWLDRIFLNFPESIFAKGLAKNGGKYSIPDGVLKIIQPIGYIPSYRPLSEAEKRKTRQKIGIPEGKIIFCYLGSGVTFRKDFFGRFLDILDHYFSLFGNTNLIFCGDQKVDRPWLTKQFVDPSVSEFSRLLAASDLVFQHQGLGTLEQAICANVPVITNVPGLNDDAV
ncbi:MAG TPA: hypothetical protein PK263_03410, partial [bacterium]|nr:hypothetical protein [bacterium]